MKISKKMCNKNNLFVLLSLFVGICSSMGQSEGLSNYTYATKVPEVEMIKQKIDVAINNFTGKPSITIPLHMMSSKSIGMDISLSYEGGNGIKYSDRSGVAGLGFLLNHSSYIVRTVKGVADDIAYRITNLRPADYYVNGMGGTINPLYDSEHFKILYQNKLKLMQLVLDKTRNLIPYYSTQPKDVFCNENNNFKILKEYALWRNSFANGSVTAFDDPNGWPNFVPSNPTTANLLNAEILISAILFPFDDEPDEYYYVAENTIGKFYYSMSTGEANIISGPSDVRIKREGNETWKIVLPEGKEYTYAGGPLERGQVSWSLRKIWDRQTNDSIEINQIITFLPGTEKQLNRQFYRMRGTAYDVCAAHATPTEPPVNIYNPEMHFPAVVTSAKEVIVYKYSKGAKAIPDAFSTQNDALFNQPPLYNKSHREATLPSLLDDFFIESIEVKSRQSNEVIKRIDFDYNISRAGKLLLEGINIIQFPSQKTEHYGFHYFDMPQVDADPATNLFSQDYWGYFNGKKNKTLFPSYQPCDMGADRSPSWPEMKLHVLTDIDYPTGGKTHLEYEPHTASAGRLADGSMGYARGAKTNAQKYFGLPMYDHSVFHLEKFDPDGMVPTDPGYVFEPALLGGIRIKQIQHSDPLTNNVLTTNYSYNKFGTTITSGVLNQPPLLSYQVPKTLLKQQPNCEASIIDYSRISTYSMYETTAPQVSYTNVTITQTGKSGTANGSTAYEYYDDTNTDPLFYDNHLGDANTICSYGDYDVEASWIPKGTPNNRLRGMEKSRKVFTEGGKLLSETSNVYTAIIPANSKVTYTWGVNKISMSELWDKNVFTNNVSVPSGAIVFNLLCYNRYFNFYYLFFKRKFYFQKNVLPKEMVTKTYDTYGNALSKTTNYFYESPFHTMPTRIVTKNSKNETLETTNIYAWDAKGLPNSTLENTFSFMRQVHYNPLVASYSKNNDVPTTGTYTVYEKLSDDNGGIVNAKEIYVLKQKKTASVIPGQDTSGYIQIHNLPLTDYRKTVRFHYNNAYRPAYVQTDALEAKAWLWNSTGVFALAEIQNSDGTNVFYSSFENGQHQRAFENYQGNATSAYSGKLAYNLSSGSINLAVQPSSKPYCVTYWTTGGGCLVNGQSGTLIKTKRGWNLYKHRFANGINSLIISGSGIIDDVRACPENTLMKTTVYNSHNNVESIQDAGHNAAYYFYDGQQFLSAIKDEDGNFIKKLDYKYGFFKNTNPLWRWYHYGVRFKPAAEDIRFSTNNLEMEMRDINPNSPTYNVLAWRSLELNIKLEPHVYSIETARECVQTATLPIQNNGLMIIRYKNINPYARFFDEIKSESVYDFSACPIPSPIDCKEADGKRMINGVCVSGTKIRTEVNPKSNLPGGKILFGVKYHYEWPNCVKSINYYEEVEAVEPPPLGFDCSFN